MVEQLHECLWILCKRCWNLNPECRMTVKEAIYFLDHIDTATNPPSELISSVSITSSISPTAPKDLSHLAESITAITIGNNTSRDRSHSGTIRLSDTKALDLSCGNLYSQWTQDESIVDKSLKFPLGHVSQEIILVSKRYKKLELAWKINISAREEMTNYHVLQAIYTSIFAPVKDDELKFFDQKWREDARESCERRVRMHPDTGGLRRVDFLCKYRWLKGIRWERENGGIHTYQLLTRKSITPEEIALD